MQSRPTDKQRDSLPLMRRARRSEQPSKFEHSQRGPQSRRLSSSNFVTPTFNANPKTTTTWNFVRPKKRFASTKFASHYKRISICKNLIIAPPLTLQMILLFNSKALNINTNFKSTKTNNSDDNDSDASSLNQSVAVNLMQLTPRG